MLANRRRKYSVIPQSPRSAAPAAPTGRYFFPSHCRMTMLPKVVMSSKGIEKASFLPAYINPRAQPYVVAPDDPKFDEILKFTE
jgi:hypothetical protein